MDEENLDDKEEKSEESRAVREGQRKTTTPARASNPAHRGRNFAQAVEVDKDMKQVSYDYCCVRYHPGTESATILVSKDRVTRMLSAHVVPLKGAVIDWVIQQYARDSERLGHDGQITLKSDQEPAIVDVLKEIANLGGLVERC